MYKRLITDGGLLSTPRCNRLEFLGAVTTVNCDVLLLSPFHLEANELVYLQMNWEAGATGAANSISIHQAQLCLNIFSKWKLLKGAILGIFWNWCHLSSAEGWAFWFIRGWQDYSLNILLQLFQQILSSRNVTNELPCGVGMGPQPAGANYFKNFQANQISVSQVTGQESSESQVAFLYDSVLLT